MPFSLADDEARRTWAIIHREQHQAVDGFGAAGFRRKRHLPHDRFSHGRKPISLLALTANPVAVPKEEGFSGGLGARFCDCGLNTRILAKRNLQAARHIARPTTPARTCCGRRRKLCVTKLDTRSFALALPGHEGSNIAAHRCSPRQFAWRRRRRPGWGWRWWRRFGGGGSLDQSYGYWRRLRPLERFLTHQKERQDDR